MSQIAWQPTTPQVQSELADAAQLRYLEASQTTFTETEGKLLSMQVNDEVYPIVYLHCSFPHTDRRSYISVRTIENKELGMIRTLHNYSEETVALLEKHIQLRYFAPAITKVIQIKEEFGYSYWEAETTAGRCRFTVRRGGGNVQQVTSRKLLVTDVDGNRFIIEDTDQLSEKEYRMVEMCF